MFGFGEGSGTVATEETETSPWHSRISNSLLEARKGQSGDVAGSPKGTKKTGTKDSGGGISDKVKEQLGKLFAPSQWEPIVKAPFAFMQAWTGRKAWELEKKEVDALATTTSTAAEYLAITDPKWLAFGMCAVTWTMIFSEKLILATKEAREEALKNPKPDIAPKATHGHTV